MLALTFANKEDYDKVQEDDSIDIIGLTTFTPGQPLTVILNHANGTMDIITVNHTIMNRRSNGLKQAGRLNVIRSAFAK
jgi:aconitate hydratase